jgi:hypothetical protein
VIQEAPTPKTAPFEFIENPPYADVKSLAYTVQISREVADDIQIAQQAIDREMDFTFHPWKRPHRNPFPPFDPVPRFTRLQQQAREARKRIVGAFDVLRHGVFEPEDEW